MDGNIENLETGVPGETGTEDVATTTEEVNGEEGLATSQETTEEAPKIYTEEDLNRKVNEIVAKRISRKEDKIRKEYEGKYGDLERVLAAGTGEQDMSIIADKYRKYYESKGVAMPTRQPDYSQKDIEVLAKAEARDIIDSGWDEVIAETDRLAAKGVSNMNQREKELFHHLASHVQSTERNNALAKIGVTEDVYTSKDFLNFATQFKSDTPITKVYDLYSKMQPKKETQTMGSMTQTEQKDTTVKDFYSCEEARKFTNDDFDRIPGLYEAVCKSMTKWK